MVNLRSFLVSQGLDLAGWTLTSAEGISADGLTIVGTGVNPAGNQEAWMATIPEPSTIALAALSAVGLFGVHFGKSLRSCSKSACLRLQTPATVFTDSYGKRTVRVKCI
jgi:hypothetical protein